MEHTFSGRLLARQLRRSLPAIMACSLIGALLGLVYGLLARPQFQATTSVILGQYAMPSSVAMQGAINGSGPLGVELPPETLVLLVPSPAVTDLAAKAVPAAGTSAEIGRATSVAAPTTNTVDITSTARTAEQAVARANAVASGLRQYRRNVVTGQLDAQKRSLARTIATRTARIKAIDADPQSRTDAVLQAERDNLTRANAGDMATQANLDGVSASFDGGLSVSSPATTTDAKRTPSPATSALVGLLAGLLLSTLALVARAMARGRLRMVDAAWYSTPILHADGDWADAATVPPALLGSVAARAAGDQGRPVTVVEAATSSGLDVPAVELLNGSSQRAAGHFVEGGSLLGTTPPDVAGGRRVVLVADQYTTRPAAVRDAVASLEVAGASVLGVVLLDPTARRVSTVPRRRVK